MKHETPENNHLKRFEDYLLARGRKSAGRYLQVAPGCIEANPGELEPFEAHHVNRFLAGLIRRGELILKLGFVENYQAELDAMNHGKEGRPYKLTPNYIQFLTAFRYLHVEPYRQLKGLTRAIHKLVPQLPSGDYSGIRKRSLGLDPDPYAALKHTARLHPRDGGIY